jgi:uroporphyrinogen-III synthase
VRILVGRAKQQAPALSRLLRRQGATVIEIPFIEIRPPQSWRRLDDAIKKLTSYDWLVLTSVNGVQTLFARMQSLRLPRAALSKLHVAAIGPATRAALEKRGVRVAVTPREYVAEAVVEALKPHVIHKRVLLVRARVARDVIPRELRSARAKVDVVAAYETALPAGSRSLLRKVLPDSKRRPHVITFSSSSIVRNFATLASGVSLDGIRMASIGPVTSATMRELGLRIDAEAREYTMEGLAQAISRLNF